MASRICFPDIGNRLVSAPSGTLRQNRVESSGCNYYFTRNLHRSANFPARGGTSPQPLPLFLVRFSWSGMEHYSPHRASNGYPRIRGRKTIPDIKEGQRGDAMTPSLPCAMCGHIDDLEIVNPLGTHADKAVIWNCSCGNTRAVVISHHTPQELVRKAIAADKMGGKRVERGGGLMPSGV
jgi:hypothetical protein